MGVFVDEEGLAIGLFSDGRAQDGDLGVPCKELLEPCIRAWKGLYRRDSGFWKEGDHGRRELALVRSNINCALGLNVESAEPTDERKRRQRLVWRPGSRSECSGHRNKVED